MARPYRFGDVEVRPAERQVLVKGRRRAIGPRAFDVLMALIERRDRVVSKGELLKVAWPHAIVEENNLEAQISALRKSLGRLAFATVPGRGYQFAMALDDDEPEAVRLHAAAPTNLGRDDGPLIGREADLEAILALLRQHQLLSLVGSGGVGKTRLAKEVARQVLNDYPHGVWWVDLASASPSSAIAAFVSRAMGFPLGVGQSLPGLCDNLAHRQALLLLDNCERVCDQVALAVEAFLASASGIRVLATSQKRLRLAPEQVYRLEGLAVPAARSPLEQARSHGSIALLEKRMALLDHRVHLDESNLEAAIEVCARLGGNPLAIAMAAARVPALGLAALRSHLDQHVLSLRSAASAPERQESLRATLEWSHSLLDDGEQAMLRRLSVFAASFCLEPALVVSTDASDRGDATDSFAGLVDKCLVHVEQSDPPRYRLLDTTRAYAAEMLTSRGEASASRRRHCEAMGSLAEEAVGNFRKWDRGRWLAAYAQDHADLQAAFDYACDEDDAHLAGIIAEALNRLDSSRNDFSGVRERKRGAWRLLPSAQGRTRALLLNVITRFPYSHVPEIPRLETSHLNVAAWRCLDDRIELYQALGRHARNLASARDFDAADRALAEARSIEDPAWPSLVRLTLASQERAVTVYRGDAETYTVQCKRELELAREGSDERAVAHAQSVLGEAALMRGDVSEAIRLHRASIETLERLDQPFNYSQAFMLLTAALVRAGDVHAAKTSAAKALRPMWDVGMGNWLYDHLSLLAALVERYEDVPRMQGIADAIYCANQDSRQSMEMYAVREAERRATKAIGAERMARLRAEAALLGEEQALRAARELLKA